MSWYKKYKLADLQKVAYPYSTNLCPNCDQPLLIDFYWERVKRNIGLGIGHCPYGNCKQPLKAELLPYKKVNNKEESAGFRFSNIEVISEKVYFRLKQSNTPEILFSEDSENMSTQHIYPDEQMGEVSGEDPLDNPLDNLGGQSKTTELTPVAAFSKQKIR